MPSTLSGSVMVFKSPDHCILPHVVVSDTLTAEPHHHPVLGSFNFYQNYWWLYILSTMDVAQHLFRCLFDTVFLFYTQCISSIFPTFLSGLLAFYVDLYKLLILYTFPSLWLKFSLSFNFLVTTISKQWNISNSLILLLSSLFKETFLNLISLRSPILFNSSHHKIYPFWGL